MKEWGATGAAVAVVIFGGAQWGDYREFRGKTISDLATLKENLLSLRAQMAASQPDRPQNQAEAREVLSEAKQKSIPLQKKLSNKPGKPSLKHLDETRKLGM
jgi:hypothetical protein